MLLLLVKRHVHVFSGSILPLFQLIWYSNLFFIIIKTYCYTLKQKKMPKCTNFKNHNILIYAQDTTKMYTCSSVSYVISKQVAKINNQLINHAMILNIQLCNYHHLTTFSSSLESISRPASCDNTRARDLQLTQVSV